jgi:hypothetical protein
MSETQSFNIFFLQIFGFYLAVFLFDFVQISENVYNGHARSELVVNVDSEITSVKVA